MLRLITTLSLFHGIQSIASLIYWFKIQKSGKLVYAASIAGPNNEYIIQGQDTTFVTFTMNWDSGAATFDREFNLAPASTLNGGPVMVSSGYNIIVARQAVYRFTIKPGGPLDKQQYGLPSGFQFTYPRVAFNTIYIFVGFGDPTGRYFRIEADKITDTQEFAPGCQPATNGVIEGTGWVMVSCKSKTERKLLDYTNGYIGGTNSSTDIHTKTGGDHEVAFMSPEDARGYYVIFSIDGKVLRTIKDMDGQERLNYGFDAEMTGSPITTRWIQDTDLCVIGGTFGPLFLVDFMDKTKTFENARSKVDLPNGKKNVFNFAIWSDQRGVVAGSATGEKSYVYKIPPSEQPCAALCATCDDFYRKKCLSCPPNSSSAPGNTCNCDPHYYEAKLSFGRKHCVLCPGLCKECSGGGEKDCTSCKENAQHLGDGSCSCRDGFEKSRDTCVAAPPEETTMNQQQTKTIIKIESPAKIRELTQNITLTFTPSLKSKISSEALTSITAETILSKNLRITFKKKEKEENELTIIEKSLNHSDSTKTSLFIKFLEKLRYEKTEYLKLTVTNLQVYEPPQGQTPPQPTLSFTEQWTTTILIEEKEKTDHQKDIDFAKISAEAASVAIATSAAVSLAAAACYSSASSLSIYLVKFFNILEIISNLGNLNVGFGENIEVILTFLDNISLPKIEFLARLSPIKDSEPELEDSSAYQTVTRGSRAKMTEENSQVFIASGQNYVISLVVVISWFLTTLFEQCLNSNNGLLKLTSFVYRTMIGLIFFDYQAICMAEIAFFDYKRMREIKAKFKYSLFLSVTTLILIISEILSSTSIIPSLTKINDKQKLESNHISKTKKHKEEPESSTSPSSEMIFEKYTEVINLEQEGNRGYQMFVVIGDIRFFVFQIVIVCLQHLNRTQSLFVLIINLVYFAYFLKAILSAKIFKSKVFKVKQVVQEVCIMVFICTITLFSFTEKTKFATSEAYKWIEYVTIGSIIGACGAELLILIAEVVGQLISVFKNLCRRFSKKKGQIEDIAKGQKEDKEILEFGNLDDDWGSGHRKIQTIHKKSPRKTSTFETKKLKGSNRFYGRSDQERETQTLKNEQSNKMSLQESQAINRKANIDITLKQPKKSRNILAFTTKLNK